MFTQLSCNENYVKSGDWCKTVNGELEFELTFFAHELSFSIIPLSQSNCQFWMYDINTMKLLYIFWHENQIYDINKFFSDVKVIKHCWGVNIVKNTSLKYFQISNKFKHLNSYLLTLINSLRTTVTIHSNNKTQH